MGWIIDTINYLIGGGVWFWLYAIQEPLLGLIVGTIASVYFFLKSESKSIKWTLIFNQIIVLMFIVASVFIVFYYSSPNNSFFQDLMNSTSYNTMDMIKKTNEILRWIILSLLSVYFIIVESIIFIKLKKYKNSKDVHVDHIQTFLLISAMCMITSVIFSFLLGPVSAIEYYKWVHNGINPPSLVKFGVVFYLVPRVIKECFKTPIYAIILATIIFPTNMIITNIKYKLQNSYNKV